MLFQRHTFISKKQNQDIAEIIVKIKIFLSNILIYNQIFFWEGGWALMILDVQNVDELKT